MRANNLNNTDQNVKEITEYYKRLLNGSTKVDESEYYINLGAVCCGSGDFELAITYFKYFLKINEENIDKAGELKCYQGLGVAYYGLGDFEKAIENYLEAEKSFAEIGQKDDLKILYENMVRTYEKMNDSKKAEEYKRKVEKIKIDKIEEEGVSGKGPGVTM